MFRATRSDTTASSPLHPLPAARRAHLRLDSPLPRQDHLLPRIPGFVSVVEEVREATARYWREGARARLDETTELFPEFVMATQHHLDRCLGLQSEYDAIPDRSRSGAIGHGLAHSMPQELEQQMDPLCAAGSEELSVDPEELLRKVPFFQGRAELEAGGAELE